MWPLHPAGCVSLVCTKPSRVAANVLRLCIGGPGRKQPIITGSFPRPAEIAWQPDATICFCTNAAQRGQCNPAKVPVQAVAEGPVDLRHQMQTAGRIYQEPLDSTAHILAEALTTVQFITRFLQTLEALILHGQILPSPRHAILEAMPMHSVTRFPVCSV